MPRNYDKERLQEANMVTDTMIGLGTRIAARRLKAAQRERNRLASEGGEEIVVDLEELVTRGIEGTDSNDISGGERKQLGR